MNNIDEDIHMLKSYAGMTHKLTDNQGRPKLDQAIENVLAEYKKQQEIIKLKEEIEEKVKKLKSELETYKKIAEEIEEMFAEECVRLGSYEKDNSIPEKERIAGGVNILNKLRKRLDWARNEVENESSN